MTGTVFRVGDKVFDIRHGWGMVVKIDSNCVYVRFGKNSIPIEIYVKNKEVLLSFTEYTLQNFSQKRIDNYKNYIGKWGVFYDEKHKKDLIYKFGKLQRIEYNSDYKFNPEDSIVYYEYFEPLTEEEVRILGLTDKNVDNEEHI